MPVPAEPKVIWPGRLLAYATSSCTEPAGTEGCVTRNDGCVAMSVIGVKSRSVSKGAFLYRLGLAAMLFAAITQV